MSIDIQISSDISDIIKYFDRLPEHLKIAISDAMARSALFVEGQAKINAPVDTGRLRSSIMTELTPSRHPTRATIGPRVMYAIFVHEGTRFIKANPFLARAAKSSENEINRFFSDAIERGIK